MDKIFEIRAYTPAELAQLYFPDDVSEYCGRNSWRKVRSWIMRNPKLRKELEKMGFTPGLKILTPKMVKQITDEFGCPSTALPSS